MQGILTATLVLAVIGILIGIGLVFTGKKFYVEVDEKEAAVREVLPGNNCGACGYAGCDAMAAAIAKGEAPANGCPVGGAAVAEKVSAIMGVDAEAAERMVAFVKCKGSCDVTRYQGNYVGIPNCRSAVNAGMLITDCTYGCVGFGSCGAVCPQNAITVDNGIAVVDPEKCVACGLCVKECPKGLIELKPYDKKVAVQCSNKDRGPLVKKVCSAGCIGCTVCVKQCEHEAIVMDGNLAHVIYDNCVQCGKCAEKCPQKVIIPPVA